MRTRSRDRIAALEVRMNVAAHQRARLQQRLDKQEAVIAAVGRTVAGAPDEYEIAVARLAAAGALPDPGWVPVVVTIRGQKAIALVCNCGPVEPDDIWRTIRRLTMPLRRVV